MRLRAPTLDSSGSAVIACISEFSDLQLANSGGSASRCYAAGHDQDSVRLTLLLRGMKLSVVLRDAQTARVRYINEIYAIPISATDQR
jgi:hypothetical protein